MRDYALDEWRNSPESYIRPVKYSAFETFIVWLVMGSIGATGAFTLFTVLDAYITFGGV